MAGRIRQADIEALKERADISEVIGAYTTLKRTGGKLKGLCPFHQERTPSFTVDPGLGFYHCFGCQAGGDVFKFVMELEGFDFTEAVEQIARRVGYTLTYEDLSPGQRRALGERSRLEQVNARAAAWFTEQLLSDDGAPVRAYLEDRGFGKQDAEAFGLGYAPNDWEQLVRRLTTEGIDQRDLVKTGLATRNDRGGFRDRFRGRLMFPIQDAGGDVIGFGGRVLPFLDYGDFDPPKYLNTSETPLYHKSKVLYGLPQARAAMSREGEVLVCEGYTDVMALHQAGIQTAVATCGTAMGEDHVRLLTKYASRLVLAFDGDAAGAKAADRAWKIAKAFSVDVRVLVLPEGSDPADVVRREPDEQGRTGAEQLRHLLDQAESIIPFTIRNTIALHDLGSEEGRTSALQEAVALLGDVEDRDLRRTYARTEVADRLGVSLEFVTATAGRAGVTLDRHAGVAPRPVRRTDPGSGGLAALGQTRLERAALRAALQRPDLLPDDWYELEEEDFSHPRAREVFRAVAAAGGAGIDLGAVLAAAPDDAVRDVIRAVALEDDPLVTDPENVAAVVRRVLLARVEAQWVAGKAELAQLNATTDAERHQERFEALLALDARRRQLRRVAD